MQQKIKENKYDMFLILLTFLLGLGCVGGALRPCRVVAVLLLPLFLLKCGKCEYLKGLVWGIAAFYVFCLVSMLWTPDRAEGMVELVYYLVHFVLFLEIAVFARYSNNALKSLSTGWLLAVALCCVIAYWEITTGNHLGVAKDQIGKYYTGTEVLDFMRSNATFYNSNGFVAFLCFGIPWVFYGIKSSIGLFRKLFCLVTIVSAIVISLLNGSRGGLISIIIMLLIFVLLSFNIRRKGIFTAVMLALAAYFIYYLYTNSMFLIMQARVSAGGIFNDQSRLTIWGNVLKAFGDTYGLGTGIGGMNEAMDVYAHGGITISHNIFLEVLLQYGVLFAGLFVYFLWCQLKKALRVENDRKMALLMALTALPIYGIINSGYLLDAHLYVLMATIYVFANYERIKPIHKGVSPAA
jgi:O-antigen ligase